MLMALVVVASGGLFSCPTYMEDKQSLVGDVPGWEVRVGGARRELENAEMHWGPTDLIPSRIIRPTERKPGQFRWDSNGKRDHWIVCRYRHSAVVLSRRVGRVTGCVFTRGAHGHDVDGPVWHPASMVCKPAK